MITTGATAKDIIALLIQRSVIPDNPSSIVKLNPALGIANLTPGDGQAVTVHIHGGKIFPGTVCLENDSVVITILSEGRRVMVTIGLGNN